MIRTHLKRGAERLLLLGGAARVHRARLRGRVLILAYHNVLPDGVAPCGEGSLHLPRSQFAAQLDVLTRTHEVISLEQALVEGTRGGRPQAIITFDDAYRGAVTVGVEELAKRGLPVTLFVAPAFVGDGTFWWDCCAGEETAALPPGFREHALQSLCGEDAAVREWAERTGYRFREMPAHARAASEEELRSATRQAGITLGSHSWSHANLTRLSTADLHAQLNRPLHWLRERFEAVVPWVSYPYGLSSSAVERAAASAGYRGGLGVDGGWMPAAPANLFCLPRLNVASTLSLDGFRLRLAGLFC